LFTSIISSLVNQNQGYPAARDSSSTLHNQWHTGRPCRLVGQHRAGDLVAGPMGSGGWLAERTSLATTPCGVRPRATLKILDQPAPLT